MDSNNHRNTEAKMTFAFLVIKHLQNSEVSRGLWWNSHL